MHLPPLGNGAGWVIPRMNIEIFMPTNAAKAVPEVKPWVVRKLASSDFVISRRFREASRFLVCLHLLASLNLRETSSNDPLAQFFWLTSDPLFVVE